MRIVLVHVERRRHVRIVSVLALIIVEEVYTATTYVRKIVRCFGVIVDHQIVPCGQADKHDVEISRTFDASSSSF